MLDGLPIFWDYITTDEDGIRNGIRDDAPEEMKEAYKKYLEQKAENDKRGIKV